MMSSTTAGQKQPFSGSFEGSTTDHDGGETSQRHQHQAAIEANQTRRRRSKRKKLRISAVDSTRRSKAGKVAPMAINTRVANLQSQHQKPAKSTAALNASNEALIETGDEYGIIKHPR